jgi:threonine aldolase
VLIGAITPTTIRVVTHLDVDDAQVARAAEVLRRLLAEDARP